MLEPKYFPMKVKCAVFRKGPHTGLCPIIHSTVDNTRLIV